MADDTSMSDRPMPVRVREAILAVARKGRKAAGRAPAAGPEMDRARMRATSGILAERMIEQNTPTQ